MDVTRKIMMMATAKEKGIEKRPLEPVHIWNDRSGTLTHKQYQEFSENIAEAAKQYQKQQEQLKYDPNAKTVYFTDGESLRGMPRVISRWERILINAANNHPELMGNRRMYDIEDRMHKAYLTRKAQIQMIREMARRLI